MQISRRKQTNYDVVREIGRNMIFQFHNMTVKLRVGEIV